MANVLEQVPGLASASSSIVRKPTITLLSLSGVLCLSLIWASGQAARAETTQPPNLSCITEEPLPNQRVLRDCDKTVVELPPVEELVPEPPLTPSELPMMRHHDSGTKGGSSTGGGGSGNGGRGGGDNGNGAR